MEVRKDSWPYKIWKFTFMFSKAPRYTTRPRYWVRMVTLPLFIILVLIYMFVVWAVITLIVITARVLFTIIRFADRKEEHGQGHLMRQISEADIYQRPVPANIVTFVDSPVETQAAIEA